MVHKLGTGCNPALLTLFEKIPWADAYTDGDADIRMTATALLFFCIVEL